MKRMDNKAQANQLLMLMLVMFLMIFVFSDPNISAIIVTYANAIFYPIIGFGGNYPLLTLFFAGVIVVLLSSLLTNFFTDWEKMAQSQEVGRAFQKEMAEGPKNN